MTAKGQELVALERFKQYSEVIVDCIKLNPKETVFAQSNRYEMDPDETNLFCLIKRIKDNVTFPEIHELIKLKDSASTTVISNYIQSQLDNMYLHISELLRVKMDAVLTNCQYTCQGICSAYQLDSKLQGPGHGVIQFSYSTSFGTKPL